MRIDFFFQAEDGIRDGHVTGVQTCALPISRSRPRDRDRVMQARAGAPDPCRLARSLAPAPPETTYPARPDGSLFSLRQAQTFGVRRLDPLEDRKSVV